MFDAIRPAVPTVQPGDGVVIGSVSGVPAVMPPAGSGLAVDPRLRRIHAELPPGPGHILTGPVAIAGAEPGDTLEIRIESVEPTGDWGYCGHRPLKGALPCEFPVPT